MRKKYRQYKNQFQCYGCGKRYSSFHRLAGHCSQCEEYLFYKEYGLQDAPFYRLPDARARQRKWRKYWMNRNEEDRAFTVAKRRILTRRIRQYRYWRGD